MKQQKMAADTYIAPISSATACATVSSDFTYKTQVLR